MVKTLKLKNGKAGWRCAVTSPAANISVQLKVSLQEEHGVASLGRAQSCTVRSRGCVDLQPQITSHPLHWELRVVFQFPIFNFKDTFLYPSAHKSPVSRGEKANKEPF